MFREYLNSMKSAVGSQELGKGFDLNQLVEQTLGPEMLQFLERSEQNVELALTVHTTLL